MGSWSDFLGRVETYGGRAFAFAKAHAPELTESAAALGTLAGVKYLGGRRGGGGALPSTFEEAGISGGFVGGGRRHRRMNAGNARALRRALRRVSAFGKLARKVIHFTHPVAPGHTRGQMRFKFKGKHR